MANGHPKFGGTNGVPALDLGQPGGTRYIANQAKFTAHVITGPDEVATVEHKLPQQNVVFRDNLGYGGRRVLWRGWVNADNYARITTIQSELDSYRHGSLRTDGVLQAADPTRMVETQLTDADGTLIAARAVIDTWRILGRRLATPESRAMVELEIEFRVLG